ncbi:flagellar assembly protein FliW [Thiocystis violascens]|uniref:Flagellar assembly factor FliW n=1 Tax=Thiocystis violascens (strain ATCC 17096 / DSM 198 / 6111) TaxID=765911 RepID=I3YDD0_THIV6|nr:flagellar assembly protein FliW [Thiocystis violascens]AFL74998.1 hypothetical protein Thivi_3121 [Thiocystis violascens DSM 198]
MTDTTAAASNLLVFPKGIPGFESQTSYSLFHSDTESGRVYWMESRDCPEVTFTLVDPTLYGLNYVLDLTDEEQTLLQAESSDDVAVFLMLWKRDTDAQDGQPGLNANLGGPILINVKKRLGMQKILATPKVEMNIFE